MGPITVKIDQKENITKRETSRPKSVSAAEPPKKEKSPLKETEVTDNINVNLEKEGNEEVQEENSSNMMDKVVKEFSSSKWKPVEKTSSNSSGTNTIDNKTEPQGQVFYFVI